MFTAAQILYISEVLGVSPQAYRSTSAAPTGEINQVHGLVPKGVVLTPRLLPEEAALLGKILAAFGGQNWSHLEVESPEVGVLPTDIESPAIVLVFSGKATQRTQIAGTEWISLPAMSEMLGTGAHVAANKKIVWEELKRFKA